MKNFLWLFCLILISGCSYTPPSQPVLGNIPPSTTNVYFFRELHSATGLFPSQFPWTIIIDRQALCGLNEGEYGILRISSGSTHMVEIKRLNVLWHSEKLPFIAQPGENVFFLVNFKDGEVAINQIQTSDALTYIKHYRQKCGSQTPLPAEPVAEQQVVKESRMYPSKIYDPSKVKPIQKPKPFPVKRSNQEIYFELDSARISPALNPVLDDIVKYLKDNRAVTILLDGHACELGTEKYNLDLSKKRVGSVRKHLLRKGISGKRIELRSFGENTPKYSNATKEGRKQNRRVLFRFEY